MCTSEFRLDFVGGWGGFEIVEGGIDDKSVWGFVFLFSVFGFRSRFSVCRSKHRGEDVTQHRRLCIQIFQNILRRISSAAKSSFAHRFVFSSRAPQAHTDKHTQAQKVGERVSKTQSTRSH